MLCEKAKKHMNQVSIADEREKSKRQELERMCDCMRSGCCPVCGSDRIKKLWSDVRDMTCRDCDLGIYAPFLDCLLMDRGRINWCFDTEKEEVREKKKR